MFTGLIQTLGTIQLVGTEKVKVSYSNLVSDATLSDVEIGDSIAVDGACLTVVEILAHGFIAIVSPETLSRTTLGLISDIPANLESALRVGSKLGGHFVSGHIDGVGCLQKAVKTASSWEMTFTLPSGSEQSWNAQIAPYIVPKGSIAVNGVSLTVAECDRHARWFTVAVIPHTFYSTNLQYLKIGSCVNLEADLLGKYVAKLLASGDRSSSTENLTHDNSKNEQPGITTEFLSENGYL